MSRLTNRPSTRLAFAVLASLALAMTVTAAQTPATDPRWTPWLGCWSSDEINSAVCVIPTAKRAAVELVTVTNGQVVFRETVEVSSERRDRVNVGCDGWESGQWSEDGQRLYLRSEDRCGNGATRTGTELFTISPAGEWIDSSSFTMNGNTGVRTTRRYSVWPTVLPAELASSVSPRQPVRFEGRTTPVGFTEIVDATRHLDTPVVEAWLGIVKPQLKVDARSLKDLDRAGVPGPVIDVIVALAYPGAFYVVAEPPPRTVLMSPSNNQVLVVQPPPVVVVDSLYSRYPRYDCRFEPNRWDRCGGWRPVDQVIVINGPAQPQPHGRVTKQGYQSGEKPSQGRTAEPSNRAAANSASSESSSPSNSSTADPKKTAPQPAAADPPDPPRTAHPR